MTSVTITEVAQISPSYHLAVYSNKQAAIVNVNTASPSRLHDISENQGLLSPHRTTHGGGKLCVISPTVLEFYECNDGDLVFLGSLSQGVLVTDSNMPIIITDACFVGDVIIYSTAIGTLMFFDFKTMNGIKNVLLTKTPIGAFTYDENNHMIYAIDTNGIFVAVELDPSSLAVKKCKAEEDLRSLVPAANVSTAKMVTTPTGCLVILNSVVLEFVIDTPSLYQYSATDAQDAMYYESKVLISTPRELCVYDPCDNDSLQTYTFPSEGDVLTTFIDPPHVVVYSHTFIKTTPVPSFPPRRSVMKQPQLKVNYRSLRISNDVTMTALSLGLDRELYCVDTRGSIYHALLTRDSSSSVEIFGALNSVQQDLARCLLLPNRLYGIFSMGKELQIVHMKTKKLLLTPYIAKNAPDDSVVAMAVNSVNNSLFALGFNNGVVVEMDVSKGSFNSIDSHSRPIVSVGFIGQDIISMSDDGFLKYKGQCKRVSLGVLSFDICDQTILIVERDCLSLYSLVNWEKVASWQSSSPIVDAKFSVCLVFNEHCSHV